MTPALGFAAARFAARILARVFAFRSPGFSRGGSASHGHRRLQAVLGRCFASYTPQSIGSAGYAPSTIAPNNSGSRRGAKTSVAFASSDGVHHRY